MIGSRPFSRLWTGSSAIFSHGLIRISMAFYFGLTFTGAKLLVTLRLSSLRKYPFCRSSSGVDCFDGLFDQFGFSIFVVLSTTKFLFSTIYHYHP